MIVAEIGINHNGSLATCKKLIDLAHIAGCDLVKIQKRTPELCVPEKQKTELKDTPWGKMTYLEYKKKIEFSEKQIQELYQYTKNKIKLFASVWDLPSAKLMAKYTNIVKIPSAKITDIDLLEYCKRFKIKILSTGMSTEAQIKKAVNILKPAVIMHANSSYPAPVDELNLMYIQWLKKKYPGCVIGYSGHEYGITGTLIAIALGALVIERHITLSHDMWGSDQKSSLAPIGLFELVQKKKEVEKMLTGYGKRIITKSELIKLKTLRGNA